MAQKQNEHIIILPSAARTATTNGADLINKDKLGVVVVIDTTVVPGSAVSNVVTIQGMDPLSGKYYTILASAAITAVGTVVLRVGRGLTASANLVASDVLPKHWRVIVTAGNGNSATYSIGAMTTD